MVGGPALGGFIYAIGPAIAYGVCFALLLVSTLLVATIQRIPATATTEPVSPTTLFADVSFIWQRKQILGAISLDLFAVLLGGADRVSVVVRQTLVQLDTPDDMRGRVSAVNSLFIGASNELGEFRAGMAAGFIGPIGAVIMGGVGTLIIATMWVRIFPASAQRDRLVLTP